MDIIQKITIYDILGYVFPGSILVVAVLYRFASGLLFSNMDNGYFIALILIIGYAIGMVISEIAKIIEYVVNGDPQYKIDVDNRDNRDEIDNIGVEKVVQALRNAGLIEKNKCNLSKEEIKKYFTYMYADIQTDDKYCRIHNYASSELVCKNMATTFLISTLILTFNNNLNFKPEILWIASSISIVTLLKRYRMNKERKYTYTIDWFVGKYINKVDEGKDNEDDNNVSDHIEINNRESKVKSDDHIENEFDESTWNKHYVVCLHKIEKS